MLRPLVLIVALGWVIACQPVMETTVAKPLALPPVATFAGTLPEVPVAGDQVYFLEVPAMSCSSCLSTIVDSLQKTPGVLEVKSSFKDKLVVVGVDKDAMKSLEPLQLAVINAGYEVKAAVHRDAEVPLPLCTGMQVEKN